MARQTPLAALPYSVLVDETGVRQTPASVGVLVNETGAPLITLTDTATSSDALTPLAAASASLTDSAATSDSFSNQILLTDVIASADVFAISYSATIADSVASSDVVGIPIGFQDIVTSADVWTVLEAFPFALADTVRSSDYFNGITLPAGGIPECGPIPIFPSVPQSFPVKLSVVMDTTVGTTKSLREMRVPQQQYPLWDIEIVFEELVDQTQNQTPYGPFSGLTNYEQLVQQWLMMYGQTGIFGFTAPWDDSRTDQAIGTGDGTTMDFEVFRTWGQGAIATLAPVGMINVVTNVKINGSVVNPLNYNVTRSYLNFLTAPAAGVSITMTFSFYYVCRFTDDEQDFEEFSKNRWVLPSLKFRAVYWPGCQ
jgi:hypothetical protein